MSNADYSNDQGLLSNTPAQARSWLHSPEKYQEPEHKNLNAKNITHVFETRRIHLHNNSQRLKLIYQFKFHGSNVSFIANDMIIRIRMAHTSLQGLF